MKRWMIGIGLALATGAGARVFYVDTGHPQASDGNAGTLLTSPWKTIGKAASTLAAGDTVNVRAGSYSETINPQNSGTAANRIAFERYGNETVNIQGINITKSYITVKGFNISGGGSIYTKATATYCQVLENTVLRAGTCGIFICGSYNLFRHNRVGSCGASWGHQISIGGWTDWSADHIVFEYNDVSDSAGLGEDWLEFGIHDLIIRGNYFHGFVDNGRHNDGFANFDDNNAYNVWISGNVFDNNGAGQLAQMTGTMQNIVFRHNMVGRIGGWGINGDRNIDGFKIIHNTFCTGTSCYGPMAIGGAVGILYNNIAYNYSGSGSGFGGVSEVDYNLTCPPAGNSTRQPHDIWGTDPNFANYTNGDYHLQASSLAIDAGRFVTATTSAGSGTQIPVADAKLFVDGFGIADGDSVQLAGQTQPAKILSINYTTNVLTVDRSLTWTNGQGVSFPYRGSAPDMGAYEYNALPIADRRFAINPRPPRLPNPLMVTPCLPLLKGLLVYNLAGDLIETNGINRPGIYMVRQAGGGYVAKVVFIK